MIEWVYNTDMQKQTREIHQRDIARAIHAVNESGLNATVRDVMNGTGISSSSVAYYYLLHGRGTLWQWEDGKSRTLRLLPAGLRLAQDGDA